MTNPNEFNDFYGGGGNGPIGRRDYVTSDDVAAAGPQTIDPARGYAGLVELANPVQRFAVFVIDFGLLIVGQLIFFSAVLPRFVYVEPFSVFYGTAFFAALASLVFAFDCQGVSWGAWIMGVRPVHAVNANGVHGIARVSPWKLVAHDFWAVIDLFFFIGLVRIFTSRAHQSYADRNTHVVWVPYNRKDPAELPLKQRDWLLMA